MKKCIAFLLLIVSAALLTSFYREQRQRLFWWKPEAVLFKYPEQKKSRLVQPVSAQEQEKAERKIVAYSVQSFL